MAQKAVLAAILILGGINASISIMLRPYGSPSSHATV
jgi:hypothetical protein